MQQRSAYRRWFASLAGLLLAFSLTTGCNGNDPKRDPLVERLTDDPATVVSDADPGNAEGDEVFEDVLSLAAEGELPDTASDPVTRMLLARLREVQERLRSSGEAPVELVEALTWLGEDESAGDRFLEEYAAALMPSVEAALSMGKVRDTDPEVARRVWDDSLDRAERELLEPWARSIAAVVSGCRDEGRVCAESEEALVDTTQQAIDKVVARQLPLGLLPDSLVVGGNRVPYDRWDQHQHDDWIRLKQASVPLPMMGRLADKADLWLRALPEQ